MSALQTRVTQAFVEAFGAAPDLVARAPGRVNLIGEHTDCNGGFVLPMAIGRETRVAARRRADRRLRIVSADRPGALVDVDLDAVFAHDAVQPWADYPRGMAAAMLGQGQALGGADLAIAGDIPQGSGLSSSASLCVATGTALAALAGLDCDATAIALLAQAAENDFVGTRCGNMDQLISARGEAGHALLIDCRSLACTPVPLPGDVAVLIVQSGIVRGLVEGEYNQRRAQCEEAAARLGVAQLRDATAGMLDAAREAMDPLTHARASHVIGENARTLEAAGALASGDLALLGELMAASHASMRDLFAITLPPIDALAAELRALIGSEGGARMTGGGFGGAVVAVLARSRARDVIDRLTYRTPHGDSPECMIEVPSGGASVA